MAKRNHIAPKQKNAACPMRYENFCAKWWNYGASAHRKGWSWKDTGFSAIVDRRCKQAWGAGWNAQNIIAKQAEKDTAGTST